MAHHALLLPLLGLVLCSSSACGQWTREGDWWARSPDAEAAAAANQSASGGGRVRAYTTLSTSGACSCCPRAQVDAACQVDFPPTQAMPDPCPSLDGMAVLGGDLQIPQTGWESTVDMPFDATQGLATFGVRQEGGVPLPADNAQFLPDPTGSGSAVLKVTYPGGTYASSSGVNFIASPNADKSIGEEARLQYKVWFPSNFDWARGGKLPGLCSGDASFSCTGGSWEEGCWSMRIMWRAGGPGEAYAYIPPAAQTCQLSGAPGTNLECDALNNGMCFGIRIGSGAWVFARGDWNTVDMYVKLNTPGQQDGVLIVAVNGTTVLSYPRLSYRAKTGSPITHVLFASFFGGGSPRYAPPTTQTAMFKDFKLWSNQDANPAHAFPSSSGSSGGSAAAACVPAPPCPAGAAPSQAPDCSACAATAAAAAAVAASPVAAPRSADLVPAGGGLLSSAAVSSLSTKSGSARAQGIGGYALVSLLLLPLLLWG